ncbi:MAG: DUF2341 domain-containing protein [Deltaproteobacteria bacterium]|nr:DUF2341 domain-containing protein [Deltaproteobacteria bacterium]
MPAGWIEGETVTLRLEGEHLYSRVRGDLVDPGAASVDGRFRVELVGDPEQIEVQAELVAEGQLEFESPATLGAGAYQLSLRDPRGRRASLAAPVLVSPPGSVVPWPAILDGHAHRKRIDIPARAPATTEGDFPVLVHLGRDAELRASALPSGWDLTFADLAGNRLEHELEHFDPGTGELVAWVKLPVLDTVAGTTFFLYYGDPTVAADPSVASVWSRGFEGVWHLAELGAGTAGEFRDASASANDATGGDGVAASVPARVPAQIGWGQDFDGVDDFLTTGVSLIDGQARASVTLWVHLRSTDNAIRPGLVGQDNAMELGLFWSDRINLWTPDQTELCPGKTAQSLCTAEFPLDAWFHLAATLDGAEAILYVDGQEKHRIPVAALGSSSSPFNMGGRIFEATGSTIDGMIDEVRFSSVDRTPEWIALEYANQADPSTFLRVGPAEAHP